MVLPSFNNPQDQERLRSEHLTLIRNQLSYVNCLNRKINRQLNRRSLDLAELASITDRNERSIRRDLLDLKYSNLVLIREQLRDAREVLNNHVRNYLDSY